MKSHWDKLVISVKFSVLGMTRGERQINTAWRRWMSPSPLESEGRYGYRNIGRGVTRLCDADLSQGYH